MSTRDWKRAVFFLERLRREIAYDDCMGMAAQIAYYMMLSVIPFLIFVLSIISRLSIGEALEPILLGALREQMPLEAANYVVDVVMKVLPTQSSETTVVSFVFALWGSSMAVGALITTINRAYNLRPRRNIAIQKLLALGLVLVLSAILLVALLVLESLNLTGSFDTFWNWVRLPLAGVLSFAALCILYYYAPEARQRFVHILPGALSAGVLWLVASSAFRLFVQNFGNYNATYGSLAAVVILLAYFWLTGFIFLLGAEINALMKRLEVEDGRSLFRPLR